MKKILYGLMLFVLIVSAFASIPNPLDLVSETNVNGLDVVAISATVTPTFMQMSGRLKDVVTNTYVGSDVPVNFYCNKTDSSVVLMGTVFTNEDGVFNFGPESLVSEECAFGEKFYLQVSYNQEIYMSENIQLTGFSQSSGSSESNSENGSNDSNGGEAQVPEFSTLTYGLAMLIAGMGFVLLRKN